jgi:hypothetical protein
MIRIHTACTSSRTSANTIVLALCTLGFGYGRKIAQVMARRARLHVGGSGQIHQVGRSSPSNNSGFHSSNQLHQVNSILLRSTTQHHHRQWNKFHIYRVQKLLQKYVNQTKICIHRTSQNKRASRESKRLNMQRNKKEVISTPRESQSRLGRLVTLRALESENYA